MANYWTCNYWTCNVCWERETGSASPMDDLRAERDRLREAARQVIGVFMADAALDDLDGKWDAAINELEAAAGLSQQGDG